MLRNIWFFPNYHLQRLQAPIFIIFHFVEKLKWLESLHQPHKYLQLMFYTTLIHEAQYFGPESQPRPPRISIFTIKEQFLLTVDDKIDEFFTIVIFSIHTIYITGLLWKQLFSVPLSARLFLMWVCISLLCTNNIKQCSKCEKLALNKSYSTELLAKKVSV